jgi:predicted O-linked N-acetylglucosamine transferase (SPINDLY family)
VSRALLGQLQARLNANDLAAVVDGVARVLRDPRATLDERVEALRLRSIAHEKAKDLRSALEDIEKARALKPADPRLCSEAGLLLVDLGERERALEAFRRATTIDPRHFRAQANLGTLLRETGDLQGAATAYQAAVQAKPDYALGWTNLGGLLRQIGRRDEAVAAIQRAIALEPSNKNPLIAMAALLRAEGALDAAALRFEAALRLDARDTNAWIQYAGVLAERDDLPQARAAYANALAIDPTLLRALFGRHLLLPMVSESGAHMRQARADFDAGLAVVERELPARAASLSAERAMDEIRWINWLLPYHGEDDRPLQERFARAVGGVADARAPEWRAPLARRSRDGRRLRVGFVSTFFRDGTVGRYFQHWLLDLDRERFEVVVYHLHAGFDELAARIAARADVFRRCPLWQPAALARLVRDDVLDVLVYPELGLEPTTHALAALRLAPLQCAAWGHPITSGHATIDVFFSSAEMEPPDARSHYTERLVPLPGIGTRYAMPPAPDDGTKDRFGLPQDVPLFLSPQTHYKVHPDNDAFFARVLAAAPGSRLVVFQGRHEKLTGTYLARLHRAFDAHGVDAARLVVLPTVGHGDYMRINALCDAMLDTLHWSGGNTSLDALAAGLPIVTLPGRFMRGRQTLGMLKLMGISELVARDEEDYLAIAARIAADRGWRDALSARIRSGAGAVFDDPRPMEAFREFLLANG